MTVYAELPDGQRLPFPDGTTTAQMAKFIREKFAFADQANADSNLQNLMAGVGSAFEGMRLGAKQIIPGLEKPSQQELADYKNAVSGLKGTPMGWLGNFAGEAAPFVAGNVLTGGGVAAAGALGAGLGALRPADDNAERAMNVIGGGALAAGGQWLGNKTSKWLTDAAQKRIAKATAEKALNAERDAILKAAQAEGYSFPPTMTNSTKLNKTLEGLPGQAVMRNEASTANQEITNTLSRRALNMPNNVELTPANVQTVIDTAYTGYDVLKKSGPFQWDATFLNNGKQLLRGYVDSVANGASPIKQMDDLAKLMNRGRFSGEELVFQIKNLRAEANAMFQRGENTEVARAFKQAATWLEDLAERNMIHRMTNPTAVAQFRAGRRLAAKAHTVQDAIVGDNVSLSKLAQDDFMQGLLKRQLKPGDDMQLLAKIQSYFPKGTNLPQNTGSGANALSTMLLGGGGALAGGAMGGPMGAGIGAAAGAAAAGAGKNALAQVLLSPTINRLLANPSYGAGLVAALPRQIPQAMPAAGGVMGNYAGGLLDNLQ